MVVVTDRVSKKEYDDKSKEEYGYFKIIDIENNIF